MEETPTGPRVSAIIVNFNLADSLRRCLEALENSVGREALEIVVVDSGSGDGSAALEEEFQNATFLKLPKNFGFTKALNIGMRTARAELFLILDPRVEVAPDTVETLASCLETEPSAAAVCPMLYNEEGQPEPHVSCLPTPSSFGMILRAGRFPRSPLPTLADATIPVEFAQFTALMVRAYFLKGLRYIDERYGQTWADAEIAMQIRRAGKKTLLLPAARATVYRDPDPFTKAPGRVRSLLAADWVTGAATYAGKHFGFLQGLKIRAGAALRALAGLHLGRVAAILSGSKVDGTQT